MLSRIDGIGISDITISNFEILTIQAAKQSSGNLNVALNFYNLSSIDEANFGVGSAVLYNSSYYWIASRNANCG